MHSFKDALGREWDIPQITVGHIRKVRDKAKCDLGGIDVQATLIKLLNDPVLTTDVLFAVLAPDTKGVTADQFDSGFFGDAIKHARAALWEALHDFFWEEMRVYMRALIEVINTTQAAILTAEPSGIASTESPPKPESTPNDTALAS